MTNALDLGILRSKTIQFLFGCIHMELKEEDARTGRRGWPWRRRAAAPLTSQPCRSSVVDLEMEAAECSWLRLRGSEGLVAAVGGRVGAEAGGPPAVVPQGRHARAGMLEAYWHQIEPCRGRIWVCRH